MTGVLSVGEEGDLHKAKGEGDRLGDEILEVMEDFVLNLRKSKTVPSGLHRDRSYATWNNGTTAFFDFSSNIVGSSPRKRTNKNYNLSPFNKVEFCLVVLCSHSHVLTCVCLFVIKLHVIKRFRAGS